MVEKVDILDKNRLIYFYLLFRKGMTWTKVQPGHICERGPDA